MNEMSDDPTRPAWDLALLHNDTGKEGGSGNVQDGRDMGEPADGSRKWRYSGLHLPKNGNHSVINALESTAEPTYSFLPYFKKHGRRA